MDKKFKFYCKERGYFFYGASDTVAAYFPFVLTHCGARQAALISQALFAAKRTARRTPERNDETI